MMTCLVRKCQENYANCTAKSSMTGDSDVILPYPDVCGAAVKRTTVIIARASLILPKDWITLHGTLAQTACAIECTCSHKFPEVEECLEEGIVCVTSPEVFKTVCLDNDVLYTALVPMHKVREDKVETPIINR